MSVSRTFEGAASSYMSSTSRKGEGYEGLTFSRSTDSGTLFTCHNIPHKPQGQQAPSLSHTQSTARL